jgi:CRISPR-associated endonuclease/helicase Cas3
MKRSINRTERLRQIENLLLDSPNGYTAPELASRLGVSRVTIWRDLRDLESTVPLSQEGDRFFIERHRYISNIRLSVAESLMLYLAIRHQTRRLTHIPTSMVTAAKKLASALRHPLSEELKSTLEVLYEEHPPEQPITQVWEQLIEGWLEGITVRIVYHKFHADEPAEYEVQPYLFEPAVLSEGVYLIGYSLTHEALRTFKVERISRARLTTLRFERPTNISVHDLLRHAWGVWYGEELTEVRLRFADPTVARRVKETLWHPSQIIEELPGGGIEWRVRVAGVIELLPWIRGWGADCEVLAPPSLRQRLAEEMRRAAALYEGRENNATASYSAFVGQDRGE